MESVESSRSKVNEITEEEEEEDGEKLDPRVQDELNILNSATGVINKLETELEQARSKFRSLLGESTTRLNFLHKKLGKCVNKARPYYEAVKLAKQAQCEAQRAAIQFQRANSVYKAAKETVALAEERLVTAEEDEKREFDSAWQEMLNHATMRVMESEKEKTQSEQAHMVRAATFHSAQQRVHDLEKQMRRSINRSKPYFEMKEMLEIQLQQQKQNVDDLQRGIHDAKTKYSEALGRLESISEEVHNKRKQSRLELPPRTPGVGAECSVEGTDLPDLEDLKLDIECESIGSGSTEDPSDEDFDEAGTTVSFKCMSLSLDMEDWATKSMEDVETSDTYAACSSDVNLPQDDKDHGSRIANSVNSFAENHEETDLVLVPSSKELSKEGSTSQLFGEDSMHQNTASDSPQLQENVQEKTKESGNTSEHRSEIPCSTEKHKGCDKEDTFCAKNNDEQKVPVIGQNGNNGQVTCASAIVGSSEGIQLENSASDTASKSVEQNHINTKAKKVTIETKARNKGIYIKTSNTPFEDTSS